MSWARPVHTHLIAGSFCSLALLFQILILGPMILPCRASDDIVGDEKSPLLTEEQKTTPEEGKTQRKKNKKTEHDFQTIHVPGTGVAVRKLTLSDSFIVAMSNITYHVNFLCIM